MIKKILTLEGVSELNQNQQKAIVGAAFRRCCEYEFINGRRVCTLWVGTGQYCP